MSNQEIYKAYRDIVGRIWLIGGDTIWCWDPADQEGLGGHERHFPMEDGSIMTLKGPWVSNPGALLVNTGIQFQENNKEEEKV